VKGRNLGRRRGRGTTGGYERGRETEEFRRDAALRALSMLSIEGGELSANDDQFLRSMTTALEPTSWDYGFALSSKEMEDVKDFMEKTASLSDEEFVRHLRGTLKLERRW
jgi:hypothetical protein